MAENQSKKAQAWKYFDAIAAAAAPDEEHSNPWQTSSDGEICFSPDYRVLEQFLSVPLVLSAGTQSGVPALALDVWLSYELRRAGFHPNQVWPRPTNPRIFPAAASALIDSLPSKLRNEIADRVSNKTSIRGVTSSAGTILGKNYLKQVDVIISDWSTGPELLVSTKRMDSSYGKNAPNRIEESYGDAKNLRLRHPLAATGFLFGLNADILLKEPNTAEWLFDLLIKLGREEDAYHATCVILMSYSDPSPSEENEEQGTSVKLERDKEDATEHHYEDVVDPNIIDRIIHDPIVSVVLDRAPDALQPARFLATIATQVLEATPIDMHPEVRRRIRAATPNLSGQR
ncbi:MAG: hypothetical protein KDA73_13135 [Rhodobacteraceae bacterium]|nr:hypothetical protein [Paracoccaceae bacterium]